MDLLRVCLAILIFLFHSHIHLGCDYGWLNDFVSMGAIAMTGFMILSGYVLYITYQNKDISIKGEIKSFYLKRLISILPLYYTVALIHVVCELISGDIIMKDVLILLPGELFLIQSTFFTLFPISHNSGTWFISCILIAYLVFPYIQQVTKQLSDKSRLWLILLSMGMLLYAPLVGIRFNLEMITIYANPFYRLLEFMIGIMLAQICERDNKPRYVRVLESPFFVLFSIFMLVTGITIALRLRIPADYMLYNWIALPCFIMLFISIHILKLGDGKIKRVILFMSEISFTFYLCQVLPLWVWSRNLCQVIHQENNISKILVSFILCLLGALLIHLMIEKPVTKYLRKRI